MAVCPKLAEGDIIRATRVDSCGAPVEGADNAFVDECWASVVMAPITEAGTDIRFRAANGNSCGFKRGRPTTDGFDITATFFSASPELIELYTGNPIYLDWNDQPIGWDEGCPVAGAGFALEIWQNIVGEDCPTDGDGLWFYWLLPWIQNGTLGERTINNEGINFVVTGNTRANNRWEFGPYDVQAQDADGTPGPLLTDVGPNCHVRGFLTSIEPPTPACDLVVVPAVSS